MLNIGVKIILSKSQSTNYTLHQYFVAHSDFVYLHVIPLTASSQSWCIDSRTLSSHRSSHLVRRCSYCYYSFHRRTSQGNTWITSRLQKLHCIFIALPQFYMFVTRPLNMSFVTLIKFYMWHSY
jgi:hypothetical protein